MRNFRNLVASKDAARREALCGNDHRRRNDYNGIPVLVQYLIWFAELHLEEAVLAHAADLAAGMALSPGDGGDLRLAGLPGLIRRAAIEAREAGGGFFGFDCGFHDHLSVF